MRRKIEIRQINIAMHDPHNPQAYVDLIAQTYRMRRVFKRGRADGYMLGALYHVRQAVEKNELHGEFYRFTNIDPNAPWFNTQTGNPAGENESDRIDIPRHLQPNLEMIPFIFKPREHRLWYVSKDRKAALGPRIAESMLQTLFDATMHAHNFPPVEVTVVPDKAAVDEVLGLHRMTRLTITFKRPNPDDAHGMEQYIMEKMRKRNINRMVEVMTSKGEGGIVADADLSVEAQAAAINGVVVSEGYDNAGRRIKESTINKPALYFETVDDAIETTAHVLTRISERKRH